MTYKVIEKITVANNFKTKTEAEDWASNNLPMEDEDRSWSVKKE